MCDLCLHKQFVNITITISLRNTLNTLEKGLCKNTNQYYYSIILQKAALLKKEKKIWNKTKPTFGFRLLKENAFFRPILTPEIPTPLDCQLPFRNPREPIFQWPLISPFWDTIHWTEFFSICQSYFLALQVTTFSFISPMNF